MSLNAKDRIINRMADAGVPLAVHEFSIDDVSENSVAARLRELRAGGKVFARMRAGKGFKEWLLTRPDELPLG